MVCPAHLVPILDQAAYIPTFRLARAHDHCLSWRHAGVHVHPDRWRLCLRRRLPFN